MTIEELNKLKKPWIRIGIRPNTSPYLHSRTEMFLIDHSEGYHGCVVNRGYGSHYDLGFLSLDANDGYIIIVNDR